MSRPQATPRAARARGADNRRAELIEAARRVIQRSGFARATVGAITARRAPASGCSTTTSTRGTTSSPRPSRRSRARTSTSSRPSRAATTIRAVRLAAYLDLEAGPTARAGGCGSTRGARRCTPSAAPDARAVRPRLARGAGRRAGRRRARAAAGAARIPEDAAGRLVAALDGIGLHTTLHGEDVSTADATRWARRLVELELGVTLPEAPLPEPARPTPTPHEMRISIRGRDLDATGRVHPAVLLTYVGEAREAGSTPAWAAGAGHAPRGRPRVGRLPPRARAPRRRGGRALRARWARHDGRAHARDDRDGGRSAGGQRRRDRGRRRRGRRAARADRPEREALARDAARTRRGPGRPRPRPRSPRGRARSASADRR